jgi:hypothetical protein
LTVAVPSAVPPALHEVGGADCGPKTLNAIARTGLEPDASTAATDDGAIGLPAFPDAGAVRYNVGVADTVSNRAAC